MRLLRSLFGGILGPVLVIASSWLLMIAPQVPYNVRELLAGDFPVLSLLAIVLVLYWVCTIPVLWCRWLQRSTLTILPLWPVLIFLHGLTAYLLLRLFVPLESLHDLVGTPVLAWPSEVEMAGRFIALSLFLFLMLAAGALANMLFEKRSPHGMKAMLCWTVIATACLPICHWVVVTQAATDNLTELMARGGDWQSSFMFACWLFLVACSASALCRMLQKTSNAGRYLPSIALLATVPLGYFLLRWGTAADIGKYGQNFSALQFLFSPDRSEYLSSAQIMLRYGIFHLLATLIIAMIQAPAWKYLDQRPLTQGAATR